MNDHAREIILEHFCERRNLSDIAMSSGLQDMICAVSAPYLLMIECLDQLDNNDPASGLLLTLIDRTYETVAGALTLISLRHLQEAEILSRSILESSVTTSFIVHKNPPARLAQYFKDYIQQEKEQNRKWRKDMEDLPPDVQADHMHRIEKKNDVLATYEKFVNLYISQHNLGPEVGGQWPGLLERFTELGYRIDYRTVYASMCSQTHHDAEDILNNFIVNSVTGADHLAPQMQQEKDTFSIFMVLFGLKWFVKATAAVCTYLKFPTAANEAEVSLQRVVQELQMIAAHIDTSDFPETWLQGEAVTLDIKQEKIS